MKKNIKARKLKGVVVSDKMNKTAVVEVKTMKVHPKYGKRYISSKKYKCHDEKNEFLIGDKVTIAECRPISKDKTWRIIDKSN